MGSEKFKKFFIGREPTNTSAGPSDSTSSKNISATEKALRASCQNPVVMAVCFLNDHLNRRKLQIYCAVGHSVKRWHQEQAYQLRSCGASLTWLRAQIIEGQYRAHLVDIWHTLQQDG